MYEVKMLEMKIKHNLIKKRKGKKVEKEMVGKGHILQKNHQKIEVALLTSDKIDLPIKSIARNK